MADTSFTSSSVASKPSGSKPAEPQSYKVADKRDDGTVVLEQEDGSMFVAKVDEALELRRGSRVTIKSDGIGAGNAPENAVVEKVL